MLQLINMPIKCINAYCLITKTNDWGIGIFLPDGFQYFFPTVKNLTLNLFKFELRAYSHFKMKRVNQMEIKKSQVTFFESAFFLLVMMSMSSNRMTNISTGLPESSRCRGPSIRICLTRS